ncbi:unnamed protein product [Schistosoma turkestanicum]|nr:unnamed protein product [Schistosoma turkestanicum]
MITIIIKQYLVLIIQFSIGLTAYNYEPNHKVNFTKPIITHSPTDVFSTDSILEFTCQASGYPKPTIVWYDASTGKQVIDEAASSGTTSGIHVNQHYGKLLISNPEKGKLYSFYCNASNSAGWTISQPPVHGGSVYISSRFQQIPIDKTVHEGDKVVLECTPPTGLPEVKVYWLKNNHLLIAQNGVKPRNNTSVINELESNNNNEILIDGSLKINPVSIKDSGTYTCVAANIAGEQVSPSAYLMVKPRTQFLETPVDIRVKKGHDVKLKCRVEGNHVVKWKRGPGEEPIDPNRAELTESYLLIKNVRISDAGTYICTAPGGIEADATVTVDTPPAFSVTPDDLTVNEGETAIFHCIAAGHPMPAIYWELPDKTPIFPGDQTINGFHNGKHYLTPEGSLEVRDVRQKDSGKYQCTAHSSIDTIHTSATLHVINLSKKKVDSSKDTYSPSENQPRHFYSSDFHWLAPIIGLPPANQTRTVGELVTLNCELGLIRDFPGSLASKFPYSDLSDWSIGWHRSTQDGVTKNIDISNLPYDRRYTLLPRGSLQISNVRTEDSGNYTCFAKADLKTYIDGSLASLTLQSNWTSFLDIVPDISLITQSLGDQSTLPPPENLRATNVTSSTVILVWDPSFPSLHPQEFTQGIPMSSHQITYWVELYRPDRPTDGWIVVEKNWHANTVQLGGLQPDTVYYFLIRPRWDQGTVGWASAPLGPVLTLKEPAVNHQINHLSDRETLESFKDVELQLLHLYPLSPKRVRVSWSITEAPHILSMITGYSVYYREIPLMKCITNNPSGTYSDMTESLAKNGERIYCSIKSTTSIDSHSLYRLETMQTLQQNFKNTQQQQQQQEFMNSTSNTWLMSDVKVQYQKDGKYNAIHNLLTIQETSLLRDLEAFRCYEVKIKAYTSKPLIEKHESRESNTLQVLTYETFPSSPPERIFAVWISNSTIELSWDPPSVMNWNGLLIGYIIYVYDEDASNHQNFNLSYIEQKTLIKGLTGKTTYFVQMAAVTCKGIGVRSTPIQLKPELRQKGLGVGWGFDVSTGQLLQFMNLDRKEVNKPGGDEFIINQPWLIVTIICSLLVWCATVTLITFCCRHHQRYKFRKSAGTVLIANNNNHSQCGSLADGSNTICTSINNSMTENKIAKTSHLSQKDHVQMEPLLRSETPNTDGENCLESVDKGKYTGWRQYPSTTQNQSLFNNNNNVTNIVNDEYNHTSKNAADTPQFNSFNPIVAELSRSPCLSNEINNTGLYATTENITNTITHHNQHPHHVSHIPQTNHVVFHAPNGLINPALNECHSHASYLSYQSHLIPPSQIGANLPNGYHHHQQQHHRDQYFSPVTRIGLTGLPLIAPVAPINSLPHTNQSMISSHSTIHDCNGPVTSLTVAPYATASLIHTAMNVNNAQRKNCTSTTFYTLNNGIYDDDRHIGTPSELTYEFDDSLTPSVSTSNPINVPMNYSKSCMNYTTNACCRTNNNTKKVENDILSQFSPSGQYDLGELLQRQDIRSKSNSATSSSLTNDDEKKSSRWKTKPTIDLLTNELSGNSGNLPISNNSCLKQTDVKTMTIVTTTTSSSQHHPNAFTRKSETTEGNCFSYEDKSSLIPPPPKSPPPPAPSSNHHHHHHHEIHDNENNHGEQHELTVEYSSSSLSSLNHTPHSSVPMSNEHKPMPHLLNTNNPNTNIQCLQLNNNPINNNNSNKSSVNAENIYYSNFCSSDDEQENEQIDNKKFELENLINSNKKSTTIMDNLHSQINYSNHYQQQPMNSILNSTFSIDNNKHGFIQRPMLLINEHQLPNPITSSSSSFCNSLSPPEEHSSSTYAQVY